MKLALKLNFLLISVVILSAGAQQNKTDRYDAESIIAASQEGAMPLFFEVNKTDTLGFNISHFSLKNECFLRNGLQNFFYKSKNVKLLTIGYLGGSITRADNQYRTQSMKYIQNMFPKIKIRGINAGVSGTGTDLGACRLYDQVLKYNPDLIFVEFAVNGGPNEAMEGIIRQIINYNSSIDICLIYTISGQKCKLYADGKTPNNIEELEKIASYYNIPSIHMGLEASILEKSGKLIWEASSSTVSEKIIFSNDGVHPTIAGGNLYTSAIARTMEKLRKTAKQIPHSFPNPMFNDNWEDAQMLDPDEIGEYSNGWMKLNPQMNNDLIQFSGWFPYILKADKPGEFFTFKFSGNAFGIFDIGGPEVGQIEIEVDGKKVQLSKTSNNRMFKTDLNESSQTSINRFNKYCNNRYRGQFDMIEVEKGIHTVKLSVSPLLEDKSKILGYGNQTDIMLHPKKYNQQVIYLGKILLRGKIVK